MVYIGYTSNGHPFVVDDEDAELVSSHVWHGGGGSGLYPMRTTLVDGKRTTQYLHRVIVNAPAGLEVDHINADTFDCRRSNLRIVTRSQNEQAKKRARSDSATGLRGVAYDKQRGRYYAYVYSQGRKIWRGRFDTLEEADAAAQAGRREIMTHAPECEAVA